MFGFNNSGLNRLVGIYFQFVFFTLKSNYHFTCNALQYNFKLPQKNTFKTNVFIFSIIRNPKHSFSNHIANNIIAIHKRTAYLWPIQKERSHLSHLEPSRI
jgi:hypothetical protein